MKNHALYTTVAALVALAPASALAQDDAPPTRKGAFTLEERKGFYEKTRRDPLPYILLNLAVPGTGNLLNDQPLVGAGLAGVWGLSVFMFAFGATNDDPNLMIIGSSIALGTYAGSMISTSFAVDAHNDILRRRYKLTEEDVATRSPGVTLTLRF